MGGVDENTQTREVSPERLEAFRRILAEAVKISEDEGIAYIGAGSLASNHWGRPSAMGDVDLVINPTDAKRLLKAFDAAGYETEESDPQWLYKAAKDDVTVDLIFQMEGALYLDDKMVHKGVVEETQGVRLRLMAPEDFVVSQAMSAKEDTPDYWYNALGVLAKSKIDWDYLLERASRGPRRVLSLIIYAQSDDLPIPDSFIRRLFVAVYGH
jgi:predicted nucleotidyltransferase